MKLRLLEAGGPHARRFSPTCPGALVDRKPGLQQLTQVYHSRGLGETVRRLGLAVLRLSARSSPPLTLLHPHGCTSACSPLGGFAPLLSSLVTSCSDWRSLSDCAVQHPSGRSLAGCSATSGSHSPDQTALVCASCSLSVWASGAQAICSAFIKALWLACSFRAQEMEFEESASAEPSTGRLKRWILTSKQSFHSQQLLRGCIQTRRQQSASASLRGAPASC